MNKCTTCKRPIHLGDNGWLHDEPTITCVAKGPALHGFASYGVAAPSLTKVNARINKRLAKCAMLRRGDEGYCEECAVDHAQPISASKK